MVIINKFRRSFTTFHTQTYKYYIVMCLTERLISAKCILRGISRYKFTLSLTERININANINV